MRNNIKGSIVNTGKVLFGTISGFKTSTFDKISVLFLFFFLLSSFFLAFFNTIIFANASLDKSEQIQISMIEESVDSSFPIVQAAASTEKNTTPLPTSTPEITLTATPTPSPLPTATPTPLPTATPTPIPTIAVVADLETLFTKYSDEYHVDKEQMKHIAKCESNFNSQSDAGLYTGMFQFAAQTWISNRTAMGLDANTDLRKNVEESIRTAAFMLSRGQQNAWPNCH